MDLRKHANKEDYILKNSTLKPVALPFCLLLIICFIFYSNARGQGIVSEENRWNVLGYDAWYMGTETYIIDGDSSIGNYTYKAIWMTLDSVDATWTYQGLLREDSNIVYYVPPGADEGVLYDFNLDAGESRDIINMFCTSETVPVVVESIDTFNYFGVDRKRWHISVDYKSEEMWIEGIGSNMGILHSMYYYCIFCPAWELMCFHQDEQLLYSLYGNNDCYIVGIEENTLEQSIEIYPNPAREKFEVRSAEFGVEKIEIFDMQGRQVMEMKCNGRKEIFIDCTSIDPGLYLCHIQSSNQLITNKLIIQ